MIQYFKSIGWSKRKVRKHLKISSKKTVDRWWNRDSTKENNRRSIPFSKIECIKAVKDGNSLRNAAQSLKVSHSAIYSKIRKNKNNPKGIYPEFFLVKNF